ncbi:MAG: HAMP domain-containing histidine kinase [Bacteroidales bacterium]|nr:HAMP domain-containing histidine kinase [Bacteroidales bacterium]MCQ2253268.1 HAMP domain-containing histidine kinase [Bacteroidales bacterium]
MDSKLNITGNDDMLRVQNAFLNNISHEIRTPLNAIIGCSEIISMPDTDRDTVAELSQQLRKHSNYLLKMLDNIIILSKLESGLIKCNPSKFDVGFLFSYIYHSSKSLVATDSTKRGRISYRLENNLGDAPVYVWADDTIICQMVNALVDNAIKFTDDGSVVLDVRISADSGKLSADYVLEVTVSDTGLGIPLEGRDTIFGKFKKLSPDPSRIFDGAGLGLALVKTFANLLNGSVSYVTEPGKGSVFTLKIPVVRY